MAETQTPLDVLVAHQRKDISSCLCGWNKLGQSFCQHQIEALNAAGFAIVARDINARLREYQEGLAEIEAILADGLGYQHHDDYGWDVGDHTPVSLALEAKSRLLVRKPTGDQVSAAIDAWQTVRGTVTIWEAMAAALAAAAAAGRKEPVQGEGEPNVRGDSSDPGDYPMPPETLTDRLKADGRLWRIAYEEGRLAALAAAAAADGRTPDDLRRLRAVLAELVDLKDGPRGANYERRKPAAWAKARAVVAALKNGGE